LLPSPRNDHADFGFLEVEGQAGDAAVELDHFVEHHVAKPFDFGDAVADLADHADVGAGDTGFEAGDFGFEFLQDVAHGKNGEWGIGNWLRLGGRG
jgi:hypothetical protein